MELESGDRLKLYPKYEGLYEDMLRETEGAGNLAVMSGLWRVLGESVPRWTEMAGRGPVRSTLATRCHHLTAS